jgi:hypothetical protein
LDDRVMKKVLAALGILLVALAGYAFVLNPAVGANLVLILSDGTNVITGVQKITVTGGTVGGSGRNATLTLNGATFANPSATIGTSANNGVATTAMRSDASPAIPQCSASTFGACKVNGTTIVASSGVISPSIPDASKTTSYPAAAGDMGGALNLAATTGTPALTLPAASSTIFAPGMTLAVAVTGTVNWTITNSTGLTMTGLNSTTLPPGASGTFVANANGTGIDFFPGMQPPTASVLGGVESKASVSHQFLNTISTSGVPGAAQPACADLSDSVASCNTLPTLIIPITYVPGINPNNIPIFRANASRTVTGIVCRPEVAAGGVATISVVKAASGTALSAGTVLHSGSFNANGTAATDQTLTVTTSSLASGDTVGITTTGTTVWTSSGIATGVCTVYIQ